MTDTGDFEINHTPDQVVNHSVEANKDFDREAAYRSWGERGFKAGLAVIEHQRNATIDDVDKYLPFHYGEEHTQSVKDNAELYIKKIRESVSSLSEEELKVFDPNNEINEVAFWARAEALASIASGMHDSVQNDSLAEIVGPSGKIVGIKRIREIGKNEELSADNIDQIISIANENEEIFNDRDSLVMKSAIYATEPRFLLGELSQDVDSVYVDEISERAKNMPDIAFFRVGQANLDTLLSDVDGQLGLLGKIAVGAVAWGDLCEAGNTDDFSKSGDKIACEEKPHIARIASGNEDIETYDQENLKLELMKWMLGQAYFAANRKLQANSDLSWLPERVRSAIISEYTTFDTSVVSSIKRFDSFMEMNAQEIIDNAFSPIYTDAVLA
ncbi:MAG: hypothetical protein M3P33_01430 [bacterium]|nr:hypothetical protein [bacterium]